MRTIRHAFTLVELLVTISIIGIMAALSFGALQMARESGKESATKATIAKLNGIIMHRYESYLTRRVPVRLESCPPNLTVAEQKAWANENQWKRLHAIRDLMRMELPDAKSDVVNGPIAFTTNGTTWALPEPALHKLYTSNPPTGDHDGAQCLYLIVAKGSPEAMEQFHQSEIGTTPDGRPCFVDGWGKPIMFLRWAPGYKSSIQSGDQEKDHDSFDSRKVDAFAFHLVPLIYSSRGKPKYGIDLRGGPPAYVFAGNPYGDMLLGSVVVGEGGEGNITNHSIEMR